MVEPPYRSADLPPSKPPPRDYVFIARERDVNAAFHRVWIRTLLFGICGGACVATTLSPAAAWIVILGVLAWSLRSWRRTRRGDAIVFRVDEGRLSIFVRGARDPLLPPLALKRVRDVKLDSRSIDPVMRDTSITAVAPQMKVRGAVDIARIVVIPAEPGEPIAITKDDLAHMDAVEGAGKIRSFLRAHGWVPEDEREAQSAGWDEAAAP
jgi:hypothetical protein